MRRINHPFLSVFTGLLLVWAGAASGLAGEGPLVVEDVLIRVIEEVEVPAREAGAVAERLVQEGDTVHAGELIAQLDDELERLQVQRAEVELDVARKEAENTAPVKLAEKSIELQRQAAEEHALSRRIAHFRAENELKVEAARKQRDVNKNELDRGLRAKQTFADSISDSELDGRRLSYEHAQLSAQQAEFEHEVDRMLADAEDLAAVTHTLSIERATLEREDAEAKHQIASLNVPLNENQLAAARIALERRRIHSPIEGIVVEMKRHQGEWIEPGETLARIVRLDKLRAEGFLAADLATQVQRGTRIEVQVRVNRTETVTCEGTVTFVSPEIDPVNREVRIWADFENPNLQLRPGMHGSLTIMADHTTHGKE
jgi:multidrug efflux pump subunit AcrA (membrane-fusion protein)